MAEYKILYWKDIPAQIKVFEGRRPISYPLPAIFQEEIDRIAMEQGILDTNKYLEHWHWTERAKRHGTPAEVIDVLVKEFEEKFPNF